MTDGTHEIDFTVTSANETNQFVFDYIIIIPSTNVFTSQSASSSTATSSSSSLTTTTSSGLPTATPHSNHVGAIAGGTVGGAIVIGIVIFALGLCMGCWSCPCIRSGSTDEGSYMFRRLRTSRKILRVYPRSSRSHRTISSCPTSPGPSLQRYGSSVCVLDAYYYQLTSIATRARKGCCRCPE